MALERLIVSDIKMFIVGKLATNHICDVEDLPGHRFSVMRGRGREPEFLECLIHQFLQGTNINMCAEKRKKRGKPAAAHQS